MDLLTYSNQSKVLSFHIPNDKFVHLGFYPNDVVVLGQVKSLQNNKVCLLQKDEQYYFGLLCHITENLWSLNTSLNEVLLFIETEVTLLGEIFSVVKVSSKADTI